MFCSKIQLSKKIVKKNELKRKKVHRAENTFIHKCTKYSQSFKR